jgi:sulfur carrier protein
MRVLVNGNSHEVGSTGLVEVLDELGYGGAVIATALNGEFIPINARPQTSVAEGDRIEIVAPMQGG